MQSAREVFDTLNTDYLTVHKTKEDLFWDTYMAVSSDDAGFARAEEAYKNFISRLKIRTSEFDFILKMNSENRLAWEINRL